MFGDIFDGEVSKEQRDFEFGPYRISLFCVAGENQHIDKWVPLVVWRAAEAFNAELITAPRKAELKGKRIVELGSGTGVCGLLAARIGGNATVLTDGSEDSVEALEESIALNKFGEQQHVDCARLIWGDVQTTKELKAKFGGEFDVCVATDVIYEAAAVKPLLVSASELVSSNNGVFFLANHRFRFHGLRQEIDKSLVGMPFALVEVTRIGEDVDLYVFRRPS
jgi:predicted nicotinamide N-methyase